MISVCGEVIKNADKIREEKGRRIANVKDSIKRLNDTQYRVRSQSSNGICCRKDSNWMELHLPRS